MLICVKHCVQGSSDGDPIPTFTDFYKQKVSISIQVWTTPANVERHQKRSERNGVSALPDPVDTSINTAADHQFNAVGTSSSTDEGCSDDQNLNHSGLQSDLGFKNNCPTTIS